MSRIYVVTDTTTGWKNLVEAETNHQSVSMVVAARYESKAATPNDVVEMMSKGAVVMRAKKLVQAPLLPEDGATEVGTDTPALSDDGSTPLAPATAPEQVGEPA